MTPKKAKPAKRTSNRVQEGRDARWILWCIYNIFGRPTGTSISVSKTGYVVIKGQPISHLAVAKTIRRELLNFQIIKSMLSRDVLQYFWKLLEAKRDEVDPKWRHNAIFVVRDKLTQWLQTARSFEEWRIAEIVRAKVIQHKTAGEIKNDRVTGQLTSLDGRTIYNYITGETYEPRDIIVKQLN